MPKPRRKHPSLTLKTYEETILRAAVEEAGHEVFRIRQRVTQQLLSLELLLQAYMYEHKFSSRSSILVQVNGRFFF